MSTPSYHVRRLTSPVTAGKTTRAAFTATWPTIEADLMREVGHLRGRDVVLELDVTPEQIRMDGRIRAGATPATSGVRLSFTSSDVGPLQLQCGRWLHWQDNVRAIGLTLAALRSVNRWQVAAGREQYRGWSALPASAGTELPVGER
jgi:hypothetical protein